MSATAEKKTNTMQLPEVPGGPWGTSRAYEYCMALAGKNHENYPVASWLLPKDLRRHVAAIYAFARRADNFADAREFEGRRADLLDQWENALRAAYHGDAEHPIFVALKSTIDEYDLPLTSFLDLITAYRMDLRVVRYPTFATLLKYCEKSAYPIGRLILALFSDQEPEHLRAADDFTTGIQLLSFWQQVPNDFALGRVYLPEEDMLRFGVSEADLRQQRASKQFKALLAFEVARTRSYLLRGLPLVDFAPKRVRGELQLIAESALVGLSALERAGYDVYRGRIHLSAIDWLRAGTATARARILGNLNW